jgi:hypothetical protein
MQNDNHENEEEEGNEAEGEDDEDYTPLSDTKMDKMYRDADEMKTSGNEALIPTGRLRDLLNNLDITTPLEFRIKGVPPQDEKSTRQSWTYYDQPSQGSSFQIHLLGCSS